jgi:hypothetical protein
MVALRALQRLCYYLCYSICHVADSILRQSMLLQQGEQWRVRLVLCQVFSHSDVWSSQTPHQTFLIKFVMRSASKGARRQQVSVASCYMLFKQHDASSLY